MVKMRWTPSRMNKAEPCIHTILGVVDVSIGYVFDVLFIILFFVSGHVTGPCAEPADTDRPPEAINPTSMCVFFVCFNYDVEGG